MIHHLETGIDFNEVVIAVLINEKFDRSGVFVADVAGETHSIIHHLLPNNRIQIRSRCDLYDFLVPPLNRTVALVQVDDITGSITEDLNFDVAWSLDKFLYEHSTVAESGSRFRRSPLEHFLDLVHFTNDPHTAATASVSCFEYNRQTVRLAKVDSFFGSRYRS